MRRCDQALAEMIQTLLQALGVLKREYANGGQEYPGTAAGDYLGRIVLDGGRRRPRRVQAGQGGQLAKARITTCKLADDLHDRAAA